MSKRMIDSEVSDRIKYRYDEGTEESHLDIDADNIGLTGYVTTSNLDTDSVNADNIEATYGIKSPAINLTNKYTPFNFYAKGQQRQLSGDKVVNHQLYLHCVKLTSATKTVYVNVISQVKTKATNKDTFWGLVDGGQGAAHVNWYYGTDTHLVHAYYNKDWQTIDQKKNVVIDGEPVTAFEGFDPMNICIASSALEPQ